MIITIEVDVNAQHVEATIARMLEQDIRAVDKTDIVEELDEWIPQLGLPGILAAHRAYQGGEYARRAVDLALLLYPELYPEPLVRQE
jgi:hypothetical protein